MRDTTENRAALGAVVMAVLLHVRAEARRAAFQLDLADEAAFHERVERVVNSGVGNIRHRLFGANVNFIRRRMVALVLDHVIDAATLRRETKAAGVQPFTEFTAQFFLDRAHCKVKISASLKLVKI